MSASAATMCPRHPSVAAQYTCSRCQSACCLNCCYSMPDGSVCCTVCYNQPASGAATATAAAPSVSTFQGPATSTPARGCPQHPLLPPVAFCQTCGKGSCVTCDFFFPPNIHLCPVCVATAHAKLTPRRKKYLTTAFCTGGFSSLGVVATLSGAFGGLADNPAMEMMMDLVILFVVTIPTAIGTGVAWAAFKPGGPNPITVWLALVWNGLLLCTMVLLYIIGNLLR